MTKTCSYLITYLFEELKLNRIEIRCAETNRRSCAIPERLGFRLEGKLRGMVYTQDGLTDPPYLRPARGRVAGLKGQPTGRRVRARA